MLKAVARLKKNPKFCFWGRQTDATFHMNVIMEYRFNLTDFYSSSSLTPRGLAELKIFFVENNSRILYSRTWSRRYHHGEFHAGSVFVFTSLRRGAYIGNNQKTQQSTHKVYFGHLVLDAVLGKSKKSTPERKDLGLRRREHCLNTFRPRRPNLFRRVFLPHYLGTFRSYRQTVLEVSNHDMRTKRTSTTKEDASTSTSQDTGTTSSLSTSALSKRAVDMLANADLSTFGEPKPDAKTLAEIREGATRLAAELDEYLRREDPNRNNSLYPPTRLLQDAAESTTSSTSLAPSASGSLPSSSTLSDESIADLQLATARKLREVSRRNKIPECAVSRIVRYTPDFVLLIKVWFW
jgi:hypothetical protein